MIRGLFLLVIAGLIINPTLLFADVISELKNFNYADKTNVNKMRDAVKYSSKEALSKTLGQKMGSMFLRGASKDEMKAYLKKDYAGELKTYLKDNLLREFKGDLGMEAKVDKTVEAVVKDIASDTKIEQIVDSSYAQWIISPVGFSATTGLMISSPTDFIVDNLTSSISDRTGADLKSLFDDKISGELKLENVPDVSKAVDDKMKEAGEELEKLKNEMGGVDINDLQNKINGVLANSGLPNPHNLNASSYLFSGSSPLSSALSGVSIDLPDVELPAPAYGVIQIAMGITHLTRSVGFIWINFDEIKKAYNCFDTSRWVFSEKNRAFKIVGGSTGVGGFLPGLGGGGIGAGAMNSLNTVLQKTGALLATSTLGTIGSKEVTEALSTIGSIKDEIGKVKVKADEEVLKLQKQASGEIDSITKQVGDEVESLGDEIESAGGKIADDVTKKSGLNDVKSLADEYKCLTALTGNTRTCGLTVASSKEAGNVFAESSIEKELNELEEYIGSTKNPQLCDYVAKKGKESAKKDKTFNCVDFKGVPACGQCKALANYFSKYVIGSEYLPGEGTWDTSKKGADIVDYRNAKPGDIFMIDMGDFNHYGIIKSIDQNKVEIFDSNSNDKPPYNMDGILRKKTLHIGKDGILRDNKGRELKIKRFVKTVAETKTQSTAVKLTRMNKNKPPASKPKSSSGLKGWM